SRETTPAGAVPHKNTLHRTVEGVFMLHDCRIFSRWGKNPAPLVAQKRNLWYATPIEPCSGCAENQAVPRCKKRPPSRKYEHQKGESPWRRQLK
ncbi:MAG: hypothetical protein RSC82_07000, partial [Oscillospiraceae bacterium]